MLLSLRRQFLWPALLCLQLAVVWLWTQGTWPDVLIDFGREWDVPLRLAQGEVLYRDIAYFNGPASPQWNALLFRLFDSTLRTLVWSNTLLLGLLLGLLYFLLKRITDPVAAFVGVSAVIWLCACTQYLEVGNANWICPYSHEVTHGLLLSLCAIAAADAYRRTERKRWLIGAGVLCGLVVLTKCEVALAGLAGVLVLLCPLVVQQFRSSNRVGSTTMLLVGFSFLMPLTVAVAGYATVMPLQDAIVSVFGSWVHAMQGTVTRSPFYLAVLGIDNVPLSLRQLLGWSAVYALALGMPVFLSRRRQMSGTRKLLICSAVVVIGFYLLQSWVPLDFYSSPRPWPVLLLLIGGGLLLNWKQFAGTGQQDVAWLTLSLVVWAGLLLLKLGLFCRLLQYGFALAAPALALLTALSWHWFPRWNVGGAGDAALRRGAILFLLLLIAVPHLGQAARMRSRHTVPVGKGPNQFLADERGRTVNTILATLSDSLQPADSLLCLPEGVMINVLSRHPVPGRFLNFVPVDLKLFGEQAMLEDLRRAPPDWIVLLQRDTSEYRFATFGVDYAMSLGDWVQAAYEPVGEDLGLIVTREQGFRLFRRRAVPLPINSN
ncbi:glycosyltransferase family 39 protein [Planctomicrobium piriforme]|uniref:4-amino-4-deoxy-L-arabinose transferase n=1 Tax=Planctomicrobium piriforme TaxID=1576369 RepID=A0A1I3FWM3_9PLAN|nr:glycosyltransferase family 39 protein [Planctomicrobium piriforme]SFI15557.1 4-amino-4-deoxy-L-arabinose transferase [Planctomicrobium piriforme]